MRFLMPATGQPPRRGSYVFADEPTDSDGQHKRMLEQLARALDPFTTRRLESIVVGSSRCLELGAGYGSVAQWLADQVGSDGEVVATDIDISNITPQGRMKVVKHDIVSDPLTPDYYDIIHARLLLAHLPQRRAVLSKLVASLAPGGTLVIEEFEPSWNDCILDTPDDEAHRLFAVYHDTLVNVMTQAGIDTKWGRDCHRAMREEGLVDVTTEFWARSWHGGDAGTLLPFYATSQLREQLIAAGMSVQDVDRFRKILIDHRTVIRTSMTLSTSGRKLPVDG
jgi:SAM-dependent methyltransferase